MSTIEQGMALIRQAKRESKPVKITRSSKTVTVEAGAVGRVVIVFCQFCLASDVCCDLNEYEMTR